MNEQGSRSPTKHGKERKGANSLKNARISTRKQIYQQIQGFLLQGTDY